jgi:hypothetical protein
MKTLLMVLIAFQLLQVNKGKKICGDTDLGEKKMITLDVRTFRTRGGSVVRENRLPLSIRPSLLRRQQSLILYSLKSWRKKT